MIRKIISGGQSGADIGGLIAAKSSGLLYGGYMPKGCLTENGPKPEYKIEYNIEESWSPQYHIRTNQNVWASDGTIRFANDFTTKGEICTFKAIKLHKKPYIDVDIWEPISIEEVITWIQANKIEVLNVAGNRESTAPGIQDFVVGFLTKVIAQDKWLNENTK